MLSRADASNVLEVYARLVRLDAPQHGRGIVRRVPCALPDALESLTPSEVTRLDRALVLAVTALQRAQAEMMWSR